MPETTTYEALRRRGLSDTVIDRFLRPFLAGVFLEDELSTSSRFFDLVWRSFARGRVCVPAGGMRRIPQQLAERLPVGTVQPWRDRAVGGAGSVTPTRAPCGPLDHRRHRPGDRSGPAADATAAPMHAVTTVYHAAPEPPVAEPTLVLDGERRGPVVNTVVLTNAAPSYSPDSRALVSTSVLGTDPPSEAALRRELERLYGVSTSDWATVATVRVPAALPAAPPPLRLRQPVDLGDGLYVAGDDRDTPSIQGAMVSGRRAATAVLRARRTEAAA